MRGAWTLVHRYVGLVIAIFLAVAGITGALMVWYQELDRWFAADIRTPPVASMGQPALDPFTLREKVQAQLECATIDGVDLQAHPPGTASSMGPTPGKDPVTGKLCELGYDEIFVDPATGNILGRRTWGRLSDGIVNLMPFVYRLHYQLALGIVGTWMFGIAALLWTLDCFVGAYLTFPVRKRTGGRRPVSSWLARWRPAWKVRWASGAYKLNFDLHRAGGLWPWAILLVFAWSSVALNLGDQVYKPVMRAMNFTVSERAGEEIPPSETPVQRAMDWQDALAHGRALLRTEGERHGFSVSSDAFLSYDASRGLYSYSARTSADIRDKAVFTQLSFDNSGKLTNLFIPTGRHAGDTVTMWLYALHLADIWGLPYRVFICAMGVAIAMLSVTGVVIWWKKLQARRCKGARL